MARDPQPEDRRKDQARTRAIIVVITIIISITVIVIVTSIIFFIAAIIVVDSTWPIPMAVLEPTNFVRAFVRFFRGASSRSSAESTCLQHPESGDSSHSAHSCGLETSPSQLRLPESVELRTDSKTRRLTAGMFTAMRQNHPHNIHTSEPKRPPPQRHCGFRAPSGPGTGWLVGVIEPHRFCMSRQSWASLKAARSDLKRQEKRHWSGSRYPSLGQNVHILVVADAYTTDPRQAHGKKKSMAWTGSTAARGVSCV